MTESLNMWIGFLIFVSCLLILDLGVFNKRQEDVSFKSSLWMSLFYISIGILVGLFIFYELGVQSFAEYMTGFLVEKSLSLDNIFLISVIFSSLSIPSQYQRRVLFWGVVGVIVLRGIMISLGAQLIHQFAWVLYIFAFLMMVTGIKMFFISTKEVSLEHNPLLKWMKSNLPITNKLHGEKFFVYQDDNSGVRRLFLTPLFVALIMVEFTDLVFAIDSIPAIFSITQDPYIIYTSI